MQSSTLNPEEQFLKNDNAHKPSLNEDYQRLLDEYNQLSKDHQKSLEEQSKETKILSSEYSQLSDSNKMLFDKYNILLNQHVELTKEQEAIIKIHEELIRKLQEDSNPTIISTTQNLTTQISEKAKQIEKIAYQMNRTNEGLRQKNLELKTILEIQNLVKNKPRLPDDFIKGKITEITSKTKHDGYQYKELEEVLKKYHSKLRNQLQESQRIFSTYYVHPELASEINNHLQTIEQKSLDIQQLLQTKALLLKAQNFVNNQNFNYIQSNTSRINDIYSKALQKIKEQQRSLQSISGDTPLLNKITEFLKKDHSSTHPSDQDALEITSLIREANDFLQKNSTQHHLNDHNGGHNSHHSSFGSDSHGSRHNSHDSSLSSDTTKGTDH